MTPFTQHVEDYLRLRRSLGFKLDERSRLLSKFTRRYSRSLQANG